MPETPQVPDEADAWLAAHEAAAEADYLVHLPADVEHTEEALSYLERLEARSLAEEVPTKIKVGAGGTRHAALEDLDFLPDPSWLVPGVLEVGTFAALYGQPGTYKSFYALHLACLVAQEGKKVVYIAAEGFGGLKIRAAAWAEAFGAGSLPPGVEVFNAADVFRPAPPGAAGLLEDVKEYVRDEQPALVIVDTVARTLDGDENSTQDMSRFVNICTSIREEAVDCTLLAVHHTGKDEEKGMRGSTALNAATDTAIKQTKESITVVRSKNFEAGTAMRYSVRSVGASLVLDILSPEEQESMDLSGKAEQDIKDRDSFRFETNYYLQTHPGASVAELTGLVRGAQAKKVGWLSEMVSEGLLRVKLEGRTKHHFLADAQSVAGMVEA